jgi:hypothetical protein
VLFARLEMYSLFMDKTKTSRLRGLSFSGSDNKLLDKSLSVILLN